MTVTSSGSAVVTLPGETQIRIEREFHAPRHLVFRAWTTPDLIKRWWNAKRGEVTLAEVDLRVGGKWRQVMVTPDGFEVGFHGEYREIVPDERLVSTEVYEGNPVPEGEEEKGTLNTLTLEEREGKTHMTILVEAFEPEVRDAIIESGMEAGLQDALDLLEEVAATLR